jgi:hypothetical protein
MIKGKMKMVTIKFTALQYQVLCDAMEIYSQELTMQIQNSAVCSRVRATEIIIAKLKKSWEQEQGEGGEE